MAKLYFRYGAMNSGKTTSLLQTAYNYEERGQTVLLVKAVVDTKGGAAVVSRLGVSRQADLRVRAEDDLRDLVTRRALEGRDAGTSVRQALDCVLVDEAQFLTPRQVDQLMELVLVDDVPVLAYGIRSDFRTRSFPGSRRLLEVAHSLEELKTICRCGRKAIFNARKVAGQEGGFVFDGDQIAIDAGAGDADGTDEGGGADDVAGVTGSATSDVTYESLCGKCYLAAGGVLPGE